MNTRDAITTIRMARFGDADLSLIRSSLIYLVLGWSTLVGCGTRNSSANIATFDQQLQETLQITSPELRATRLTQLASRQQQAGSTEQANACLDEAVAACREINGAAGRASAYNSLASVQARVGRVTTAKNTLGLAKKAINDIDDAATKVSQLGRVALTFGRELENSAAANSHLESAENETKNLDGWAKVTSLARLAVIASLISSPDEANRLIHDATQAADGLSDRRRQSAGFADISSAYRRMNNDQVAQEYFSKAIEAAKAVKEHGRRAHALADLAARQLKRNPAVASGLLDQAEQAADQILEADLRRQASTRINELRVSISI